VQRMRKQIEDTTSDYDKEKLQERLAKMGGVAVIRVERLRRRSSRTAKRRSTTRLAPPRLLMAEGIVPGSGLALLRAIDAVAKEEPNCSGDERTGLLILKRALEAPTRQIAQNSAVDGGHHRSNQSGAHSA